MGIDTVDKEVRNPVGNGLARPGASDDQQRTNAFAFPGWMPYSAASRCCGFKLARCSFI